MDTSSLPGYPMPSEKFLPPAFCSYKNEEGDQLSTAENSARERMTCGLAIETHYELDFPSNEGGLEETRLQIFNPAKHSPACSYNWYGKYIPEEKYRLLFNNPTKLGEAIEAEEAYDPALYAIRDPRLVTKTHVIRDFGCKVPIDMVSQQNLAEAVLNYYPDKYVSFLNQFVSNLFGSAMKNFLAMQIEGYRKMLDNPEELNRISWGAFTQVRGKEDPPTRPGTNQRDVSLRMESGIRDELNKLALNGTGMTSNVNAQDIYNVKPCIEQHIETLRLMHDEWCMGYATKEAYALVMMYYANEQGRRLCWDRRLMQNQDTPDYDMIRLHVPTTLFEDTLPDLSLPGETDPDRLSTVHKELGVEERTCEQIETFAYAVGRWSGSEDASNVFLNSATVSPFMWGWGHPSNLMHHVRTTAMQVNDYDPESIRNALIGGGGGVMGWIPQDPAAMNQNTFANQAAVRHLLAPYIAYGVGMGHPYGHYNPNWAAGNFPMGSTAATAQGMATAVPAMNIDILAEEYLIYLNPEHMKVSRMYVKKWKNLWRDGSAPNPAAEYTPAPGRTSLVPEGHQERRSSLRSSLLDPGFDVKRGEGAMYYRGSVDDPSVYRAVTTLPPSTAPNTYNQFVPLINYQNTTVLGPTPKEVPEKRVVPSNEDVICTEEGVQIFDKNIFSTGPPEDPFLKGGSCFQMDDDGNYVMKASRMELYKVSDIVAKPVTAKLMSFAVQLLLQGAAPFLNKGDVNNSSVADLIRLAAKYNTPIGLSGSINNNLSLIHSQIPLGGTFPHNVNGSTCESLATVVQDAITFFDNMNGKEVNSRIIFLQTLLNTLQLQEVNLPFRLLAKGLFSPAKLSAGTETNPTSLLSSLFSSSHSVNDYLLIDNGFSSGKTLKVDMSDVTAPRLTQLGMKAISFAKSIRYSLPPEAAFVVTRDPLGTVRPWKEFAAKWNNEAFKKDGGWQGRWVLNVEGLIDYLEMRTKFLTQLCVATFLYCAAADPVVAAAAPLANYPITVPTLEDIHTYIDNPYQYELAPTGQRPVNGNYMMDQLRELLGGNPIPNPNGMVAGGAKTNAQNYALYYSNKIAAWAARGSEFDLCVKKRVVSIVGTILMRKTMPQATYNATGVPQKLPLTAAGAITSQESLLASSVYDIVQALSKDPLEVSFDPFKKRFVGNLRRAVLAAAPAPRFTLNHTEGSGGNRHMWLEIPKASLTATCDHPQGRSFNANTVLSISQKDDNHNAGFDTATANVIFPTIRRQSTPSILGLLTLRDNITRKGGGIVTSSALTPCADFLLYPISPYENTDQTANTYATLGAPAPPVPFVPPPVTNTNLAFPNLSLAIVLKYNLVRFEHNSKGESPMKSEMLLKYMMWNMRRRYKLFEDTSQFRNTNIYNELALAVSELPYLASSGDSAADITESGRGIETTLTEAAVGPNPIAGGPNPMARVTCHYEIGIKDNIKAMLMGRKQLCAFFTNQRDVDFPSDILLGLYSLMGMNVDPRMCDYPSVKAWARDYKQSSPETVEDLMLGSSEEFYSGPGMVVAAPPVFVQYWDEGVNYPAGMDRNNFPSDRVNSSGFCVLKKHFTPGVPGPGMLFDLIANDPTAGNCSGSFLKLCNSVITKCFGSGTDNAGVFYRIPALKSYFITFDPSSKNDFGFRGIEGRGFDEPYGMLAALADGGIAVAPNNPIINPNAGRVQPNVNNPQYLSGPIPDVNVIRGNDASVAAITDGSEWRIGTSTVHIESDQMSFLPLKSLNATQVTNSQSKFAGKYNSAAVSHKHVEDLLNTGRAGAGAGLLGNVTNLDSIPCRAQLFAMLDAAAILWNQRCFFNPADSHRPDFPEEGDSGDMHPWCQILVESFLSSREKFGHDNKDDLWEHVVHSDPERALSAKQFVGALCDDTFSKLFPLIPQDHKIRDCLKKVRSLNIMWGTLPSYGYGKGDSATSRQGAWMPLSEAHRCRLLASVGLFDGKHRVPSNPWLPRNGEGLCTVYNQSYHSVYPVDSVQSSHFREWVRDVCRYQSPRKSHDFLLYPFSQYGGTPVEGDFVWHRVEDSVDDDYISKRHDQIVYNRFGFTKPMRLGQQFQDSGYLQDLYNFEYRPHVKLSKEQRGMKRADAIYPTSFMAYARNHAIIALASCNHGTNSASESRVVRNLYRLFVDAYEVCGGVPSDNEVVPVVMGFLPNMVSRREDRPMTMFAGSLPCLNAKLERFCFSQANQGERICRNFKQTYLNDAALLFTRLLRADRRRALHRRNYRRACAKRSSSYTPVQFFQELSDVQDAYIEFLQTTLLSMCIEQNVDMRNLPLHLLEARDIEVPIHAEDTDVVGNDFLGPRTVEIVKDLNIGEGNLTRTQLAILSLMPPNHRVLGTLRYNASTDIVDLEHIQKMIQKSVMGDNKKVWGDHLQKVIRASLGMRFLEENGPIDFSLDESAFRDPLSESAKVQRYVSTTNAQRQSSVSQNQAYSTLRNNKGPYSTARVNAEDYERALQSVRDRVERDYSKARGGKSRLRCLLELGLPEHIKETLRREYEQSMAY